MRGQLRQGSSARAVVLALIASFALAACSGETGPTPEEIAASEVRERRFESCMALATEIADALQSYVDEFEPDAAGVGGTETGVPDARNLADAADAFRRRRGALGCEPREFQVQLGVALDELRGTGPLARAVVAQVRDAVLAIPGPAASVTVAPGDDLAEALHGADDGAVVRLEAGEHLVDDPLVVLRDVHLVGAGSGSTTVRSTGSGAVLLHIGDGTATVEGVRLEYDGDGPGSVLVVAAGGYALTDVVLRGGVGDEARSTGWGLVLGGAPGAPDPSVDQVLTDVTVEDNDVGGVVVTAGRAPRVQGLTATGNGGCGACWVGDAAGTLDGVVLDDNATGLSLTEQAAPTVTDLTAAGNDGAGVLVDGAAGGSIVGGTLSANGDVGLALTGDVTTRVADLAIDDHGEVGVLVEGAAEPTMRSLTVTGAPIGVLVRGDAAPTVGALTVDVVTEAHVVVAGDAGGAVTGTDCLAGGVPGVVVLDRASTDVADAGCTVVDQR